AKVLGLVVENVKPSKRRRTGKTTDADPADEEAFIAWQEIHDLRAAYQVNDPGDGQKIATKILGVFYTCPIPEIARLGRSLWQRKEVFFAHSRYKSSQQRRHRGTKRDRRAPPTPRPQIHKPRALRTTNAPRLEASPTVDSDEPVWRRTCGSAA